MTHYYPSPPEEDFDRRREGFSQRGGYLLDYLCDPAFNRVETISPHFDDFDALADLDEIHHSAGRVWEPLAASENYERYDLTYRFGQRWHDFQSALPLVEPERQWLTDCLTMRLTKSNTSAELAAKLGSQDATIVSAGIHRVVSGHTLLHRWLTWRREAEDYRHQGTLDIARDALHDLITVVSPDTTIPDSYVRLRSTALPTPEA